MKQDSKTASGAVQTPEIKHGVSAQTVPPTDTPQIPPVDPPIEEELEIGESDMPEATFNNLSHFRGIDINGDSVIINIEESRKAMNTLPVLTADMFEQGNGGTSTPGLSYDESKSEVNRLLRIRLKKLLYVGMGISIECTNTMYLAHFTMFDNNGLSTGEITNWLSVFTKNPQYIGIVVTRNNGTPITVEEFDSVGLVIKPHLGTVTPSTTEQATGETWDGRPIYITAVRGTTPITGNSPASLGINALLILSVDGGVQINPQTILSLGTSSLALTYSVGIYTHNNVIHMEVPTSSPATLGKDFTAIIRYTKP